MTENGDVNLARVAVILLFAVTFTLIGWLSPVLYATYIPADEVMEVHGFEAQDTTTGSDKHYICFDRTVHRETTGTVFTELYLVSEDGDKQRVEVQSDAVERYFQGGRTEVVTPFTLPPDLRAGEYQYLLVIKMELADGRVTRAMTYDSEPFTISDGPKQNATRPTTCG